jgi:hypothetical protein
MRCEGGLVRPEDEMVVFILCAYAGDIGYQWYARLGEDILCANTGSLQDVGCAHCTGGKDHELACVDALRRSGVFERCDCGVKAGVRDKFNAGCALGVVKENSDNLGFDQDVQVGVLTAAEKRMEIAMCCVLALAVGGGVA